MGCCNHHTINISVTSNSGNALENGWVLMMVLIGASSLEIKSNDFQHNIKAIGGLEADHRKK